MTERPLPQVKAAIAAYRPRAVSDEAGAFAREVVGAARAQSPARAKALLFCASRLARFGESVGLDPRPEALLCDAVIERFIRCGCVGVAPATRRTLRSNLRALQRSREAHPQPAPRALPRERAKAPYSQAQIAGYLALAGAQSTVSRRMRTTALICLGAGAGLVAGELRLIRGVDVVARSGGVLVEVGGARARAVPVLLRFQQPLLAAAHFAGESYIVGGHSGERRNLTDSLARLLSGDPVLPPLQSGRLRCTWLHECARAIGLHAFMAAAGVVCSQRLGDIAASLPAMQEAQMVAALGASQ